MMRRLACLALVPAPSFADDAEILSAVWSGTREAATVSVTLRHGDTGWDDYADGWRVVLAHGAVIATRTLYHPHVDEQPFTRSLGGVALPPEGTPVFVEARTLTGGWGAARVPLSPD